MYRLVRNRQVSELSSDLETLRMSCERVGDAFVGLSVLFGGVAVLVAAVAVWAHAPIFAMSAGFALAASLAFAVSVRELGKAGVELHRKPVMVAARWIHDRPARLRKAA